MLSTEMLEKNEGFSPQEEALPSKSQVSSLKVTQFCKLLLKQALGCFWNLGINLRRSDKRGYPDPIYS